VADVAGKAYAITVPTPMASWKTPILRTIFWVIGTLGVPRKDQENLRKLSFIHFARWVIIPREKFPRLSVKQPREDLAYDYMLFCSNFNGSWEQYIDAFSEVIPGGMNNIWRWSVKYPGSRPITPFLSYIAANQIDNEYYYNATPGATTTDILRALELQAAMDKFIPASSGLSPAEFQTAFNRFLIDVQSCLGSTGPDAVAVALDTSTSSAAMASDLVNTTTTAPRAAAVSA
jgi:hypothetical protein